MIFEILKWIFAGSLGGVVTFLFKYREDKRKAHVDDVTKHRIEWTQKLKINLVISLVYLWLIFRTGKKLKSHLFYSNLRQISDE